MEEAVGLLLPRFHLLLVRQVLRLVKGSVEILGVDTDHLGTLLTETERSDGKGVDAIRLDAATGVNNVIELLQRLVNVIGIAVSRNQTGVQDLQAAVEHPSTSSTLRVSGEVLLEDTHKGIALLAAKVLHLLADDIGLVLVVGNSRSTVERRNTDIVDGETPSG